METIRVKLRVRWKSKTLGPPDGLRGWLQESLPCYHNPASLPSSLGSPARLSSPQTLRDLLLPPAGPHPALRAPVLARSRPGSSAQASSLGPPVPPGCSPPPRRPGPPGNSAPSSGTSSPAGRRELIPCCCHRGSSTFVLRHRAPSGARGERPRASSPLPLGAAAGPGAADGWSIQDPGAPQPPPSPALTGEATAAPRAGRSPGPRRDPEGKDVAAPGGSRSNLPTPTRTHRAEPQGPPRRPSLPRSPVPCASRLRPLPPAAAGPPPARLRLPPARGGPAAPEKRQRVPEPGPLPPPTAPLRHFPFPQLFSPSCPRLVSPWELPEQDRPDGV